MGLSVGSGGGPESVVSYQAYGVDIGSMTVGRSANFAVAFALVVIQLWFPSAHTACDDCCVPVCLAIESEPVSSGWLEVSQCLLQMACWAAQ